jgi:hypothetical protein
LGLVTLNLTLTKIITIYFAGGLNGYVYDAAQVIASKIAKKPFDGIDRGDSLVFQDFIQSWVGYKLVKVLNVFGLQPKIRSYLATWSPHLFAMFTYKGENKETLLYNISCGIRNGPSTHVIDAASFLKL